MGDDIKVSIIIPVYRYSENLKNLLSTLLHDEYSNKEIIIVVDEPTPDFFNLNGLEKCKVILHKKRVGKVQSLNEALKVASGDYYLFLDSDVEVPEGFVSKALNEAIRAGTDVIDFIKLGKGASFIGKMASIDYALFNFFYEISSKFNRKIFALDGAAFMIKAESMKKIGGFERFYSEDLQLGLRTYLNNMSYYLTNIKIRVLQPKNLKDWADQRIRWGYGLAEWAFHNILDILKSLLYSPWFLLAVLIFVVTPLTSMGLFYLVSSPIVNAYLMINMINPLIKSYPWLSKLPRIDIMSGFDFLMVFLGTFLISIVLYSVIVHRYEGSLNLKDLILYYFVYQPMLSIAYLIGFTFYLAKLNPTFNWKKD